MLGVEIDVHEKLFSVQVYWSVNGHLKLSIHNWKRLNECQPLPTKTLWCVKLKKSFYFYNVMIHEGKSTFIRSSEMIFSSLSKLEESREYSCWLLFQNLFVFPNPHIITPKHEKF